MSGVRRPHGRLLEIHGLALAVLRLSVVCNVCIVAKRCVLLKKTVRRSKQEMAYRESNGQVTLKGQRHHPNTLMAQHLQNNRLL